MLNTEEALKKSDEYHAVEINKLREVIKNLQAENARYREDLEFYKFTFNNLIEDPKILHLIQIHEERLSYVNDSNITPDELRSILKYALILNIKNTRYREALQSIHDDMSRTVDMKMDHVQEGVEDKAISTIVKATTINKLREALKGKL